MIQNVIKVSLRNWWLFTILFVLISGGLIVRNILEPPTFRASFTYMVQDDNQSSSVSAILGQFGIGTKGRSFNLDRVMQLAKSRRIMSRMMFDEISLDQNSDFIANHVIDIYELDQKWEKRRPEFAGFRFSHADIESFDELERTAFLRVYNFLAGREKEEGLIFASYSEDSGVLSMGMQSLNMDLSILATNLLFDDLREYYVNESTARFRQTFDIVKSKTDSLSALIRLKEIELAEFQDANNNLYSRVADLRRRQLENELLKLHTIHGEALKNLEIADFSLRNATPSIEAIDKPIGPLAPIKQSNIVAVAIGGFLSLLLGGVILYLYHILAILRSRKIE